MSQLWVLTVCRNWWNVHGGGEELAGFTFDSARSALDHLRDNERPYASSPQLGVTIAPHVARSLLEEGAWAMRFFEGRIAAHLVRVR